MKKKDTLLYTILVLLFVTFASIGTSIADTPEPVKIYENEYTTLYDNDSVVLSYQFLKEANEFKYELLQSYELLFDNMENMLHLVDDEYFYDVLSETDLYQDYLYLKQHIDSLYQTQL